MTGVNTMAGFSGLALYEMMRLIRSKAAADKSFFFVADGTLLISIPTFDIVRNQNTNKKECST